MSLFELRRELMAISALGYLFTSKGQHKATRVVQREEFERAWALLPRCVARLGRSWDDVVHACDATLLMPRHVASTGPPLVTVRFTISRVQFSKNQSRPSG